MKTKTTNTNIKRADMNGGETPAIEVSFRTADQDRVVRLLGRFGGCEGDATSEESVTSLASMALFLSNIAAGHLLARADGRDRELGMDFIVEGGMASADFVASVIAPTLWFQARWERNLRHDPEPEKKGQPVENSVTAAKRKQSYFDSIMLPKGKAKMIFVECIAEYEKGLRAGKEVATMGARAGSESTSSVELMPKDRISTLLIWERRATLLREATEFPSFLFRTSGTSSLRSVAARAHLGHLIVHKLVESRTCLEKLRKSLSATEEGGMSGRSERSPTIRVNQALCASSKVLDEVVATARSQPEKISGLLWLVEASPGCELPAGAASSPAPNFRYMCMHEIKRRINFDDDHIHALPSLDGHLARWKEFLREQERHLPGIATIAWNLPVALCYGLEALLGHKAKMDGAEVIALANWLVLRMCNRFAAATAPASQSDVFRCLAAKLAGKLLKHGPMTVRELCSRCSRLRKDGCLQALGWLSEQGVAACEGDAWGIVCDADAVREWIG